MYPGDLLKAVQGIPEDFWASHPAALALWKNVKVP
jgi:hypothetical protein